MRKYRPRVSIGCCEDGAFGLGDQRRYRSMTRLKAIWVLLVMVSCWSSGCAALTGSNSIKTETFDTIDSSSFCDARRFDLVEGTSGLIYSHKPYYPASIYRSGRDCFMTLKAPQGYRIELVALEFQVGERFAGQSKKCAGDSLHVFDQDKPDPSPKKARSHPPSEYQDEKSLTAILSSNTSVQSPIKANLCGRLKNNTIIARSTMNIMTLWWHSDPLSSTTPATANGNGGDARNVLNVLARRGFKLQWNAFRDTTAPAGCDEEKEFACSNQNMCIPVELACDNVAQCSDKSDLLPERQRSAGCEDVEPEEAPSRPPSFGIGSLAGICIGSLLLLILSLMLFSICRKRRRNMRSQHKYNQAPVVTSNGHTDKHYLTNPLAATVASVPSNNSSNSSSDNSRCASSSTDNNSRTNGWFQPQATFTHPYPLQQRQCPQGNGHYHQVENEVPGALVLPNGNYYQPYYMAENGEPFQTKLYHHHQHHHHHAASPLAPPPSMINGQAGHLHQNGLSSNNRNPQTYYYPQKQGLTSDATQPMIA